MEVLEIEPHWEILDSKRIDLLRVIANRIMLPECYMGGGTALSLQMGLRKSVDFDFFTSKSFNPDSLFAMIKDTFKDNEIKKINVSGGTCDVSIDGVQTSWFYHPYAVLYPQVILRGLPSLTMASTSEIAAMKASAIGGRGAKKDFFDLYEIMNRTNMDVKTLAECICAKFGKNHNYAHMCMGMSYFADAEDEPLDNVLVPYDWDTIKCFFKNMQPRLSEEIQRCINDT